MNVDDLIATIIENEGGYTDDTTDTGNWCKDENGERILVGTNWGIAAPTLKSYLKRVPTKQEMMDLDRGLAEEIYKANYYLKPKMDLLPESVQANVFDMGVNAGPGRSIKLLQQLLLDNGFDPNGVDGGIGQGCVSACLAAEQAGLPLNRMYSDARIDYYEDLCRRKPAYNKYLNGWTNRANHMAEHQV